MQSCYGYEQKTKPAEGEPVIEAQSTGGWSVPSTHEQVDDSNTDPLIDQNRDYSDSGVDGVKSNAQATEQRLVSVLDQRVEKPPMRVKRRNRRFGNGPRRLMDSKEDEEEEEEEDTDSNKDTVLIHGLSVQRYREIYHSVLTPAALSALPTNNPTEYMAQVLELKQRLWVTLSRPQFKETVREDGRVTVTEICDLT